MVAARSNLPEMVGVLARCGADLDARDAEGRTALVHAVERGHDEATQCLLDEGASAAIADNEGTLPMDLARQGASPRVLRLLLAAAASRQDERGPQPVGIREDRHGG